MPFARRNHILRPCSSARSTFISTVVTLSCEKSGQAPQSDRQARNDG
jgi:hypothetical protein